MQTLARRRPEVRLATLRRSGSACPDVSGVRRHSPGLAERRMKLLRSFPGCRRLGGVRLRLSKPRYDFEQLDKVRDQSTSFSTAVTWSAASHREQPRG